MVIDCTSMSAMVDDVVRVCVVVVERWPRVGRILDRSIMFER